MEEENILISLFSGGISSFIATNWLVNNNNPSKLRILFFDTKIEDDDTYRFLKESEELFDNKIEIITEGRNP